MSDQPTTEAGRALHHRAARTMTVNDADDIFYDLTHGLILAIEREAAEAARAEVAEPGDGLHRALAAAHSAIHSGEPCSPALHAMILDAMAVNVAAHLSAATAGREPLDVLREAVESFLSYIETAPKSSRYRLIAVEGREYRRLRAALAAATPKEAE